MPRHRLASLGIRSLFVGIALFPSLLIKEANAQSPDQAGVTASDFADGIGPLRNSISVLGGAFTYERNGHSHHPYVTLRLGRDFSRFFAGELGFGYADVSTTQFTAPTSEESSFRTPVAMADLALHAKLPLGVFVPYVGVSAGLFHRYDSRNGITPGEDTQGTSLGVLAGSKLHLGNLFGLRGELRLRADRHPGRQLRINDAEYGLGMIFRF